MSPFLTIPLGRWLGLLLVLGALGLAAWNPLLGQLGPGRPLRGRPVAAGVGLLGLALLLAGTLVTLTLPTYGVMLGLAMLAGLGVAVHGCRRRGIAAEVVIELATVALIGGFVCARVVYVVQFWGRVFAAQPPAVGTPGPVQALGDGEQLRLRTPRSEAQVAFQAGDDLARVKARLEAVAPQLGLEVEELVTRHRGPEGIVARSRGLVLRASERGPEAFLELSGPACEKLGVPPGRASGLPGRPWSDVLDLRIGGLVYFGAILGMFLSWAGWLWWRAVPLLPFLEGVALIFPVGTAIGRWGCLGAGCCWGREAGPGALLAVSYPPFSLAWRQVAQERLDLSWDPVLAASELTPELAQALGPELCQGTPPLHATPVYESLGQLLVLLLLVLFRARLQRRLGQSFALMVVLMTSVRFLDEHLRRDHEQFFLGLGYPLTVTQCVCLVFGALGAGMFAWSSKRGPPTSPQ